jgi:hypothetical protein
MAARTAVHHPSRFAEDGSHLAGERNCVHPGDDDNDFNPVTKMPLDCVR